jgi:glutamine cyclotransferase
MVIALAAALAFACGAQSPAGGSARGAAGADPDSPPTAAASAPHAGRSRAAGDDVNAAEAAARWSWRVVARHPHDPAAFTQGLLWHDGWLYESTGLYGASSLRRVDLASGRVEATAPLARELFGEGLARVGERLVQLTWREGVALLWDRHTLRPLGERRYEGEGWGLAFDGTRLVHSDGTARLTFRDPDSLAPLGGVTVTERGAPVSLLNELEWVDGALWANVWQSDELVRIDVESGRVDARLDLAALRLEAAAQASGPIDVLNGIAWRPESATLLVTGKLWPVLFELAPVPPRVGR